MHASKSSSYLNIEAESEDATRFDQSLRELRDLRSQLNYAADYCETTFLHAPEKKIVIENTKEYICRAVVTVVDHLGSISANLDYLLSKNNSVSDTELRVNCLKQKLATCQQYAHKLALTRVRWSAHSLRYYPRYISPPIPVVDRLNGASRESDNSSATKTSSKCEFEAGEEVPLFLYTNNHKPSLARISTSELGTERDTNSASALPVHSGLSTPKAQNNPPFHFQSTHKLRRNATHRESVQKNDILSLIRWSKPTA